MKPRFSNQRNHALTLVEVLVVVVVLAVLVAIFLPGGPVGKDKAMRINCVSNLKQIGLANRIWAGDQNEKPPMEISMTNDGTIEMVTTGNVAAYFQVMSNELDTPKLLICPADTGRIAATNFTSSFNNSKISYFIGLDANTNSPQVFLSGDDNFEISGVPVKSGLLKLSTNMAAYWADVPVDWTDTRHKPRSGNICFADGSVRETYFYSLRDALRQTGVATNRLAIP